MARNEEVTSLAPLKGCPKLRKLDLRGCQPDLYGLVADLQPSCPQLADVESVAVEGLVLDLQPSMPPGVQKSAVHSLSVTVSINEQTILAAIPHLVLLLEQHASAGIQHAAANALCILSDHRVVYQDAIIDAGAISPLVQLAGPQTPARLQGAAKAAFRSLMRGVQ
ncbi:hypothetical protein FOA52_009122 [Chlamydomonas sp. UWO 241]|nr:hypothetical protein FOA52_009122 [Chlamydomonas sp. UWO 241]